MQDNHSALATAWLAYRRSAATARKVSSDLRSWRWRVLAITLAGIVTSAVADTLRDAAVPVKLATASGYAGAGLLFVATWLGATLLTPARHRRWTVNRAVAEALKSDCFRFATRVSPYHDAGAATRLLDRHERLTATLGGAQMPAATASEKPPLRAPLTMEEYLHARVTDQILWYRDKALSAHASLRRFRFASVALGIVAAVLPVVGICLEQAGPASWASVATTAGTAIASFVYAERFSFLQETYTATANRLERLAARWQASSKSAADGEQLVDAVENALATENSGWMAELLREDPE